VRDSLGANASGCDGSAVIEKNTYFVIPTGPWSVAAPFVATPSAAVMFSGCWSVQRLLGAREDNMHNVGSTRLRQDSMLTVRRAPPKLCPSVTYAAGQRFGLGVWEAGQRNRDLLPNSRQHEHQSNCRGVTIAGVQRRVGQTCGCTGAGTCTDHLL